MHIAEEDMWAGQEPMAVDAPQQLEEDEPILVTDSPLDLEAVCQSYSGSTLLYRLLFIAERCVPLSVEALRLALTHVQKTLNVALYQKVHARLLQASQGGGGGLPDVAPTPPLEQQWIDATSKRAALRLERLDTELKNYKMNSIKESVRRAHDELGDHYLNCGELSSALKCYSRARDYCTSHQHILDMCINVIQVSIYLKNWTHVLNFVRKAQSTLESTDLKTVGDSKHLLTGVRTQLYCAAGLAHLAARNYKLAAKNFISASGENTELTPSVSASNVAVYGGLCALATFSRRELHEKLINTASFKQFMEQEPQLREIIFSFYNSAYGACLSSLGRLRNSYLLDMYLAPHVSALYTSIRNRALVQYFSPYRSCSLSRMAEAFNTSVASLEDELTSLILEGQMAARIDSHNGVLLMAAEDARAATAAGVLALGSAHADRLHGLLLRGQCLAQGICVKAPSRDTSLDHDYSVSSRDRKYRHVAEESL